MFSKRSVTARRCRWNTAQADTANIETDVFAMCSINAARRSRRNQDIRIEGLVLKHRHQRNLCIGTDMAGTSLPDPLRIPRPNLLNVPPEPANGSCTRAMRALMQALCTQPSTSMVCFRFYAPCRAGSQVVSMCPRFSHLTSPLASMQAYFDRSLHATSYYSPHP